ncbi:MAG TPA: hypothetical protein VG755_17570 [Nannocystaceae bacterium]|nr:hypothetical protein [Nannocystaceae bacterium]
MDDTTQPPPSRIASLLHRWLVEYNPLYLVSAALVLVGVVMLSGGLAGTGGPFAQLGITAIAEVYAWALIAGAAILVRVGLRRPAVMLALVAAFYQCDPTAHTETSVHLGAFGVLASATWLLLFVAKLYACAWALRIYLSRSAITVATLGASGIAVLPWLFYAFAPHVTTALVGAWIFATFAAGLWSSRRIHSVAALAAWPLLVARRSVRAVWLGWAAMLLVHVLFWVSEHGRVIDISVLWPVGLLLATRMLRREASLWLWGAGTLGAVAVALPQLMAITAVLAAATLMLWGLRRPTAIAALVEPTTALGPYRDEAPDAEDVPALHPELAFVPSARAVLQRLFTGALGCAYVGVWTWSWIAGAWPEHVVLLDALLLIAAIASTFALRDRLPLALPIASALHWVVQARVVPAPESVVQWGATSVALGFATLLLSLVISVRWRRV